MSTPIEDKHSSLLNGGLNLGEPLEDEEALEDGGARRRFEFGTIYFHPRTGAFECHGLILQTYVEMGEQFSLLGYPITDESNHPGIPDARINEFEEGELLFTSDIGVTAHFLVPQVAVKFADTVPIRLAQGATLNLDQLAELLNPNTAAVLEPIRDLLPNIEFRRAFDDLSPEEIEGLVAEASENNPEYVSPIFENCLQVLCPLRFDPEPLVSALSNLTGLVDFALTIKATENAGVVAIANPRFRDQEYLLPGPKGIGVLNAWLKGADGSGCHLVDIEHAWMLNREADDQHEDLPANIPLLGGFNRRRERGHGTAVLGVIAAVDNEKGVVGIAPQTTIAAISPDQIFPTPFIPPMVNLPAMISRAAANLGFGDVLLLEVQTKDDHLPVELDFFSFWAIQQATSKGIVVVQAAGNGARDLDVESFIGDSGAILVGACESGGQHRRTRGTLGSNFGGRVDCCAWGESVVAAGNRSDPVGRSDYFEFSGTSSAAAIVAGVCLLVQQMQRTKTGFPMQPLALRDVLRNANNGTLAGNVSTERIGAMPELGKIIANLAL